MGEWEAALIGKSRSFLEVTKMIPILGACKATVLIAGETGTGKEVYARALHYSGARRGKPFVPVNCAALPDHLIENELFGHSKGAFTGALTEKHGLFHEADGGTLFLDEINSLNMAAQSKLLRVLQDQEFRQLGSTKILTVDVKIIAATNADLRQLVNARQFREDLFHRLNVLNVVLPPLRERKDDIPALAAHFLKQSARDFGKDAMGLTQDAIHTLMNYAWPGNVRELQGVMHRAAALATNQEVTARDLDLPGMETVEPAGLAVTRVSQEILEVQGGFQDLKMKMIDEFERMYLSKILFAHQGNISKAARAAQKERRAFQRLLYKHGLDRRTFSVG